MTEAAEKMPTLKAEQLAHIAKMTNAITADPIVAFLDGNTLEVISPETVAPGQIVPGYALHESGAIEEILVAGRELADDKPAEYWWKIMLSDLVDLLEDMSGKQAQALRSILDQFDPSTGIILASQRELAERCGCSERTMHSVLKLMMKHNLIAMRGPGAYAINPHFMSQGGGGRYNKLLIQYTGARNRKLPAANDDALPEAIDVTEAEIKDVTAGQEEN